MVSLRAQLWADSLWSAPVETFKHEVPNTGNSQANKWTDDRVQHPVPAGGIGHVRWLVLVLVWAGWCWFF